MKYVAAAGILMLAMAVPGVNFYHHLTLPDLEETKISSTYVWNFDFPFVHKYTDITLGNEIKSDSLAYYQTMKALREAYTGDRVTFHLSGYGGDVQSTVLMIDGVKSTKAYVVMTVEAPVYSGHAYLASFGNKLVMKPYSFMMFHCSTIVNTDCSKETGTDRGVSNKEHCQAMKDQMYRQNVQILKDIPILTPAERASIMAGHDVYLTPEDINKRIKQ